MHYVLPQSYKKESNKTQEDQHRNYLPPIELSAIIAHFLPVGLTGVGPTATLLLLFLASPPDEQDEDEDKYDSHNVLFVC